MQPASRGFEIRDKELGCKDTGVETEEGERRERSGLGSWAGLRGTVLVELRVRHKSSFRLGEKGIFSPLNKFIEVKFIEHKMNPFKANNSEAFSYIHTVVQPPPLSRS